MVERWSDSSCHAHYASYTFQLKKHVLAPQQKDGGSTRNASSLTTSTHKAIFTAANIARTAIDRSSATTLSAELTSHRKASSERRKWWRRSWPWGQMLAKLRTEVVSMKMTWWILLTGAKCSKETLLHRQPIEGWYNRERKGRERIKISELNTWVRSSQPEKWS